MKKNQMIASCIAVSFMAIPLWMAGCDREKSQTSSTTVKDDGTVTTKDKTVTVHDDGTVTKQETQKTTAPNP